MQKLSIFAVTTLIVAMSSPADSSSLEKCVVIADTKKRLSCYDAIAGRPIPKGIEKSGKWIMRESANPLDDSRTVVARLKASQGKNRWGRSVHFIARCRSNKTEAFINFATYLGDDSSSVYEEWKTLSVRVGNTTVRDEKWDVSTNRQAAFSRKPIPLLREMSKHRQLVVQVTPYGENPITAIFELDGIAKALSTLSTTCNWSLS